MLQCGGGPVGGGAELARRFDGDGPGGQRALQLRAGPLRAAGQKRKLPAQLAAVPAAEQQPRLCPAQKAAAVFQPAFALRQTTAVILHEEGDVLLSPAQPHGDAAAGGDGMEGVGKQMEADLLRHGPVAPDEALGQAAAVRPKGRAALSLDLLPHPVHLADQLAEVQRELVQRLLRGGKLHHFPERPFQPGRLHSHVVQRLCGAGVGGRGKVHLQILPVLVHQA